MVAITGATGLLGTHIVDKMLHEGVSTIALQRSGSDTTFPVEVVRRTCDLLDQVSLQEAFDGASTVIHSAAYVSFNKRRRKQIFETNVVGTRHVVDTCIQKGIRNLIHISSVSALGRKPGEMITEESKWTGVLSSDYAESKYLAELEVFRGAEEGLNVSIVNPSVILAASPLQRSSATLFDYVWNERPFYTSGALNYVDVRDVADAVFKLYLKPQAGEKFILSAGQVSYQEFFTRVAKRFGRKPPHIKLSNALSYWAGWAEEVRGAVLNMEPLVTRQSAKMALQSFRYDSTKAQSRLDLPFRLLDETLDWCCADYMRNVKTNK